MGGWEPGGRRSSRVGVGWAVHEISVCAKGAMGSEERQSGEGEEVQVERGRGDDKVAIGWRREGEEEGMENGKKGWRRKEEGDEQRMWIGARWWRGGFLDGRCSSVDG